MPTYLLDTNAFSELTRNPTGRVAEVYRALELDPGSRLMTSIIVACEVRYGVRKKGSARLEQRVDRLLSTIEVVPFSAGADDAYASLRTDLEGRGQPIGQNDMLIAAHALAPDAILVTDNDREFRRVQGLQVENWLRASPGDPA